MLWLGTTRLGTTRRTLAAALLVILVGLPAGCRTKAPAGPTREQLTALLQQEAQALKDTGEKLDPVLRVKATWSLAELAVSERAGDADRPWAGLIHFHIKVETRDVDGTKVDELDKRFRYLWIASLQRWVIQPAA